MTNPFFSVVIPTKNRCELIQDALNGLAAQTLDFQLFEVVVVDNGSSDDTVSVLERRVGSYPFLLRVLKNPVADKGPAPARNHGVQNASGDVIAFLDSDCRPAPDWLECAHHVFECNPNLDFASGVIDFKPEQIWKASFFSRKTVVALAEHPTYPTANSFYRKSVFLNFGGFDESLSFPNILGQSVEAADTDLAWRIRERGGQKIFMAKAVVYHEVQVLPPLQWLMEPLRLFLLPALIRSHPELRFELLFWNLFFYPKSIIYYMALVVFLALILAAPKQLIYAPLLFAGVVCIKSFSLKPASLYQSTQEIVLNTLRNYVMCGALIYGSIRYRTLVL